ncbi:MAG: DUF4349 domain-containing protein [Mucilaginibacter sp.]
MKKLIYPALLVIFALAACGDRSRPNEKMKAMNVSLVPPPTEADKIAANENAAAPENGVQDTSKKIIKEGEISFEAGDIKETRKVIHNSLNKFGGYIAQEIETNNSDYNRKEYNIKARIPAKNFDLFLSGVTSAADKIDSKNIRIKDVTTEFIDITAQLANKKKLEGRYQDLLKQANKMSDLLEIENKLTEIRSSIESTQGQLNYLVKEVNYSTLDITFYTKQLVQDNGKTFGYKLSSSLSGGWEILAVMFFGFMQLWPIWILTGIIIYLIKGWRRRHRDRQAIVVNKSEK